MVKSINKKTKYKGKHKLELTLHKHCTTQGKKKNMNEIMRKTYRHRQASLSIVLGEICT